MLTRHTGLEPKKPLTRTAKLEVPDIVYSLPARGEPYAINEKPFFCNFIAFTCIYYRCTMFVIFNEQTSSFDGILGIVSNICDEIQIGHVCAGRVGGGNKRLGNEPVGSFVHAGNRK
jgi:hypothetical protein